MELKQSGCIKSTNAMDDKNFMNSIVLITELNEEGSIGYILNRPFDRRLNELVEFSSSLPFPLHNGGPVDAEHLYFIHQQPSIIDGGILVADNLYVGGNFKEAVEAINAGLLDVDDVKIFVGYCGWNANELQAEIAEGSWEIIDISTTEVFQ